MTCGIYKLVFEGTSKVYIGQSENIKIRFSRHLSKLKYGIAPVKLQEAYNTWGIPTLVELLVCNSSDLNNMENIAIQEYDAVVNGFNTLDKAGPPNLSGTNNGNSKYSREQVLDVFLTAISSPELTQQQLSDISGVSISSVRDIIYGKTHKWLQEEFKEAYNTLLEMRNTKCRLTHLKYSNNSSSATLGKEYPTLLSPTGVEYNNISNVREFAKNNDLSQSCLCMVLNRQRHQHKGWKLA